MQAVVRGRIFRIQRFSIHDGYGIRTTVFLKGCPLRCVWCHNPESQRFEFDLAYREEKCLHCHACVEVCDFIEGGDDGIRIDRSSCNGCGKCVEVCRGKALEIYGRDVSVDEVMNVVERDAVFYRNSGGGVTFSGGEPFYQPEFLKALLAACEERKLSAAIDTSGYAKWEVIEATLDFVDFYLYDLKDYSSERHRRMCGAGNELIVENLRRLTDLSEVIVRIPVIPGYNFGRDDFNGYAVMLDHVNARRVDLLPYHSMARDKYRWLGREFFDADFNLARVLAREFAEFLGEMGFEVTVGGYF